MLQGLLGLSASRFLSNVCFGVAPPLCRGGSAPNRCGGCLGCSARVSAASTTCGVTCQALVTCLVRFSRFRPPGLSLALWNVGFAVPWLPRSFSGLRVAVAAVLSASAKLELAWRPFHRFPDCVHAAVFLTSLSRLGVCGGYPTAIYAFVPFCVFSASSLVITPGP